jgi:hypothetical protein
MIKYIKNLLKKWFGKKEVEIVKPQPKPEHCTSHTRFKKSCNACQEIVA